MSEKTSAELVAEFDQHLKFNLHIKHPERGELLTAVSEILEAHEREVLASERESCMADVMLDMSRTWPEPDPAKANVCQCGALDWQFATDSDSECCAARDVRYCRYCGAVHEFCQDGWRVSYPGKGAETPDEDREVIAKCENCGKPIYDGEMFHRSGVYWHDRECTDTDAMNGEGVKDGE